MTALIWRIKASDVDELNNDTKARNFHASWFLCGSGGALCAEVPKDEGQKYTSMVLSEDFEVVPGDPFVEGLLRKGYWGLVLHISGNTGLNQWIAKSPSSNGWVPLQGTEREIIDRTMQDIKAGRR